MESQNKFLSYEYVYLFYFISIILAMFFVFNNLSKNKYQQSFEYINNFDKYAEIDQTKNFLDKIGQKIKRKDLVSLLSNMMLDHSDIERSKMAIDYIENNNISELLNLAEIAKEYNIILKNKIVKIKNK